MTTNFNNIVLAAAAIAVFAIGAFAEDSGLASSRWRLTHVNGKQVGVTKAFIEIKPAEERFNGNTGCNIMFGAAKISGRSITFSKIGTTKMACRITNGTLEGNVLTALEQATRFRLDGNRLNIYSGNRQTMRFSADPVGGATVTSNKKLEDKKWFLESIGSSAVGSLGREAFINFDATRASAGGNTSCNVFGGSYSVKGDSLAITDVISTMRACIEDDRMNIEREFLDGLRKTDRYEIKGEKLYMYYGKELLLTFKGVKK